jgi:hypothetical protein
MKYTITLKQHFQGLEFLIAVTIGMMGFLYYQKTINLLKYPGLEYQILLFWILSVLPVLYLHLEYYTHNKGVEWEIDSWKKEVRYTDKEGVTAQYNFEDLKEIIVYMAPSWHRKSNFKIMPFEQYHYARIKTKSGKEIIITSLLIPKVEEAMRTITGVPIELEKRIYASIRIDNFIERHTLRK